MLFFKCVTFATTIATGIIAMLMPADAQAQQKFPTKPVRLVVGYVPGGQSETLTRFVGAKLSEMWRQPVVVENRPGAGGMLAAAMVAKATPDGYTLLYAGSNFAITAALQPSLPYDPIKDFAGVTQIGYGTQVLVVGLALGVKSVKDLIALAKAQPGKIIFGSASTGSGSHLTGARFNLVAGVKVVHVAFKGGPESTIHAMTGRTHYSMATLTSALPFIKDGKLIALAVHTPQRSPVLPDVPALEEILPEFKRTDATNGLLAPAGTPRSILNQVSKDVARVLELSDTKEWLQTMATVGAPTTPEEYDKILRAQIASLSKLVRDIGLRPK